MRKMNVLAQGTSWEDYKLVSLECISKLKKKSLSERECFFPQKRFGNINFYSLGTFIFLVYVSPCKVMGMMGPSLNSITCIEC